MEIQELLGLRYEIAFLKNDKAGMERAVALGEGKPDAEAGKDGPVLLSAVAQPVAGK